MHTHTIAIHVYIYICIEREGDDRNTYYKSFEEPYYL